LGIVAEVGGGGKRHSERLEEEMAEEREIKLRIEDLEGLRHALAKLGTRIVKPRVHEHNIIFDTPQFTLGKREQLLRIRTETLAATSRKTNPRFILTFKAPIRGAGSRGKRQRHKICEEIELQVSDAKPLAEILEGLGLRGWFQYEKFRTTFQLRASNAWAKGLLLELDETPIGLFVELEGPARAIDRAAQALGFAGKDYILANYLVLYRKYCRSRGEKPGNMLFAKLKRGDHPEKNIFLA
jgi:adenylate cyclase class 2